MNNLKRITASVLSMVIVLTSIAIVNVFAASTNLSVNLNNTSVKVGDELVCSVNLDGNTGWGSLQFDVSYDNTILEYVSHTAGDALSGASQEIFPNTGYVRVVTYVSGDDNITVNGNVIDITFKAIDVGTSALTLEYFDCYDVDLNVVSCDLTNGSITVESATTPDDSTTTATTTETTTKVVTTEKQTETTTKVPVTQATTEKATEATTKAATTEKQTEATTKTVVTENQTESTTKAVVTESQSETTTRKVSSGGGSSSGAGASSIKVNGYTSKTTTEATTEAVTKAMVTTVENVTETTTENIVSLNNVKVTIGSKTVTIGDEIHDVDVAPYIQSGSNSTLVPLRVVALAISGGSVEDADSNKNIVWDGVAKTATITANDNVIEFTAVSGTMIVNRKVTVMENGVKAEIKDGRMFVPFRALGDALGVDVDWDSSTKTAIYKSK